MTCCADEIIAARRARIVEVVDARGRTIGVRRIRPSEQLSVVNSAEDDCDLLALLCAAAVTFIEDDGQRRTMAGDAREPVLWSIVSALGADGLAAVAYAVWQHAAGPAGGAPTFHPFRPFAAPDGLAARSAGYERDAVASAAAVLTRALSVALPFAFPPEAILPLFRKP